MGPDDIEHLLERYERAEARVREARDRHDRARAVGRLYEMSWKNPYAAFRAGEISELGMFGRAPDHLEAANMYLRAHRLGDTRATWRLMTDHPCSASPEEEADRSRRLFMEAALPSRTRRADGTWMYIMNEAFVEEAEARAESASWIRPMLAEALFLAGDGGCRHWAEMAVSDRDPGSETILAECLLDDAYGAEDPDDGARMSADAVSMLDSLKDRDWRARLALGREAFCSPFTGSDDALALEHILAAVSMCPDQDERRSEMLPYLEYYAASLDGLEPETRHLARSGRVRFPGPSAPMSCASLGWSAVPEWALLLRVTRTAADGTTALRRNRGPHGGFEDGTFAVVPASSECDLPPRSAMFLFKPTGLRLDLGEDVMGIGAIREELDEEQLRQVFLICVDSARHSIGGGVI